MARRRFQRAKVKERDCTIGREFYVRYRVYVQRIDAAGIPCEAAREKHHPLGFVAGTVPRGTAGAITRREAERLRDEIMARVNGQTAPTQSHVLFGEFAAVYLERHLPALAVPTQRTYRSQLATHILPYFAKKKLCDINTPVTLDFLSKLAMAPQSKATVLKILASVLRTAHEWGYIAHPIRVASLSKRQKRAKYDKTPLSDADFDRLVAEVRPDVSLILRTLYWTGMRISECLSLRPRSIDFERGYVGVTERQCRGDVDLPKTPKSIRVLPLCDLTSEYRRVCERLEPDAFIFSDAQGRPYRDCELLANYLTPVMVRLGIKRPGMGWHILRHGHATMLSGHTDAFTVAGQMGHSDVRTTGLYVHPELAARAELITALQRARAGEPKERKLRRVK